ncbi:hypothetical protein GCM10009547_16610 [Sporichthya brevicatena]|uniref:Rieske domain-containing protein n=1 Tax=Sporichthya brevicatena TaxID=171442 RepID=A0ABP3RQW8_9ACTN
MLSELPVGGVIPLRVQGKELVLWRGESGELHALDAFCQHLGAHLGYNGRVCGEDVRCFYHGWAWSPAGENTDIPYDSRTHRGRRIRPWTVAEQGGLVFLWYSGSADQPQPQRPAPDLPNDATRAWVTRELVADPRLILEALVDPALLRFLAGGEIDLAGVPTSSDTRFEVEYRRDDGAAVRTAVLDVATGVVVGPGWSLTVAILPVVDDTVRILTAITGDARASDRAMDRILGLVADMAYQPLPGGSGEEPLRSFRAWRADLESSPIGESGDRVSTTA